MSGELPKNESSFRRNNSARKSNPSNRKFLYLLLCGIIGLDLISGMIIAINFYPKIVLNKYNLKSMTSKEIYKAISGKNRVEVEAILGPPDTIKFVHSDEVRYIYFKIICLDENKKPQAITMDLQFLHGILPY